MLTLQLGIGIRFQLGDRKHTDIIAHSIPHFPTRTGAEFLQFLRHIAANTVPEWLPTQYVLLPKPLLIGEPRSLRMTPELSLNYPDMLQSPALLIL